jgi:3-oxoacyl-[acyl-carrier protein] reductase
MMNVLVTGGTGGIGSSIVEEFVTHGHTVFAPSRAELDLSSDNIALSNCNFDIVINNAGINPLKSITDITNNDVLKTNYLSPLKIIQLCLPHMVTQQYGRILNIGSIWVELSKKNRGAYSASKAALDSLSRSLTAEYAQYNILSNTLSPGYIGTSLTYKNNTQSEIESIQKNIPLGRLGTPIEVAKLVYQLTVENTYLSGQNIILDGGFSCTR